MQGSIIQYFDLLKGGLIRGLLVCAFIADEVYYKDQNITCQVQNMRLS